ncbi:MAG: hypothetical protein KAQ97_09790, partial [Candidatus Fermentibacteraceae bacterium]|nr:hypothetical protein [Candidatus Fermentibacteraceae bacterium]
VDCKSTIHRFKSDRRLQFLFRLVNMNRIPLAIRLSLLVAAILMMVSGYIWGNPLVIWQKAAIICLECIGIG